MLELVRIRNLATIDTAEIPFKPGLNMISGETGAGKSIILEAIALLLGGRASIELVRAGADEAVIEGVFDLSQIEKIQERLQSSGFTQSEHVLIIKRSISRSGKHRISINGELATLSTLQFICEGLIDLCGQHEHQSLLRSQTQVELLDRFGTLTPLTLRVSELWQQLKELLRKQEKLFQDHLERNQKIDFLNFQIHEIQSAQLQIGEDSDLHQKKQLLQSAEMRAQHAHGVVELLEADDAGVLQILKSGHQKLKTLSSLDPQAMPLEESLHRALLEVEDASLQLHRYLGGIELNADELSLTQERLSLIADLKRKYGSEISQILDHLSRLEEELVSLNQISDQMDFIKSQILNLRTELLTQGKTLSEQRKKIAHLLSRRVNEELKDLKMGEALFEVELLFKEDLSTWNSTGGDFIQFLVQTNPGEKGGTLGKIASGGELSRLMLAIRQVIADRGGIGVYLFDEIDSGMGGQTAFQVGKKLKSVAAFNQVICITHLPQVASFADHHLVVQKVTHAKRTLTQIIDLNPREKKKEIARMLGGPELTRKSLENASELLELAHQYRPSARPLPQMRSQKHKLKPQNLS